MKPPGRVGANMRELPRVYLAELPVGSEVLGFVRGPGTPFQPPSDPRTPIILVAAGTGLAPFRGFLQERAGTQRRGRDVGASLLFFGCRDPDHDFLYEPELRQYEAIGVTRLIPAFSRLPGQPKCYVQHNILRHPTEILDLLERGAVVYVCGDAARMAPDVRAAFSKIMSSHPREPGDSPDTWFAELRANNRYVEDAWA